VRIGTKSVLFGAHAFWLHPWLLALAWWKMYGFPWDPRLWTAFFVHDLGYFGKPDMDGPEGESHPEWGAKVAWRLFDQANPLSRLMNAVFGAHSPDGRDWWSFVKYHSRYLAKADGARYSSLCPADKLAIALEPWWLYLPRVIASGEIHEYMGDAHRAHPDMPIFGYSRREWFASVQGYCRRWAMEHRDGGSDHWTVARSTKPHTKERP
jgi:hypothetical protein